MSAEYIDADSTALAVREEAAPVSPAGIWQTSDPVEVIERATRVADALKSLVVAKGLISNIQGKQYPQVEAWLTLASMLSLRPILEWTRPMDGGGWEARCIVNDRNGQLMGAAEAQCTREERAWKSRDDYALRSMAQTRATSKALRSVLGFVMTLAGYQATPAEEMPSDEPPKTPENKGSGRDRYIRRIHALIREIPDDAELAYLKNDNERHSFCLYYFGTESLKDFSEQQFTRFAAIIKSGKRPEEEPSA